MVKIKIVRPSYVIVNPPSYKVVLNTLELAGRTAYQSFDKSGEGSAEKLIKHLITLGHESVLEHINLQVHFIVDRGVTHELVRHRLASYTQESTRYCNYNNKGFTFIKPPFWEKGSRQYNYWLESIEMSAYYYNKLITQGATPQEARSVLPNSLKTQIVVTANIREWRHILKLRTAKAAHPQIREVMIPLLKEFQVMYPVLFEDINND